MAIELRGQIISTPGITLLIVDTETQMSVIYEQVPDAFTRAVWLQVMDAKRGPWNEPTTAGQQIFEGLKKSRIRKA